MFIVAPSFVKLFFGIDYDPKHSSDKDIIICKLWKLISNFVGIQILTAHGMESKLLICISAGAIFNFIANLIFIPIYGSIGAATTSVLCEIIILLLSLVMMFKFTNVRFDATQLKRSFISCLPMISVNFLVSDELGFYKFNMVLIPVGVLTYIAIQCICFKNKIALYLFRVIFNFAKLKYGFNNWSRYFRIELCKLFENTDYIIIEKESSIGAYCKTIKQDGFTWDYSGHFFHFRDKEIRNYLLMEMNEDDILDVKKYPNIL